MKKFTLIFFALLASTAFASNTGMPYESGISALSNSLKGPMLYGIAVISFIVAIISHKLSQNDQFSHFVNKLFSWIVWIGAGAGVTSLIGALFSLSSAVI